jgi:hypothetical protein
MGLRLNDRRRQRLYFRKSADSPKWNTKIPTNDPQSRFCGGFGGFVRCSGTKLTELFKRTSLDSRFFSLGLGTKGIAEGLRFHDVGTLDKSKFQGESLRG